MKFKRNNDDFRRVKGWGGAIDFFKVYIIILN